MDIISVERYSRPQQGGKKGLVDSQQAVLINWYYSTGPPHWWKKPSEYYNVYKYVYITEAFWKRSMISFGDFACEVKRMLATTVTLVAIGALAKTGR